MNRDSVNIYNWVAMIICIFGVIGNWIAFYILGKMGNRNASTYLLRALAFVDSVFLVMNCFRHLKILISIDIFWQEFASSFVIFPLYGIALTAAIWSVLLVGFHRYIVVCQPLRAARVCTVGNARRHFLYVLLLSFVVNFPKFFEYKIKEITQYNHTDQDVTYEFVKTNMANSAWYYSITSL